MGRVLTNNISLAYAIEASSATLPGSPTWKLTEPNTINAYGAAITTVKRSPISKLRQNRKGTVTDLDSSVEFEADATIESILDFIEGFMFSTATGAASGPLHLTSYGNALAASSVSAGYTYTSITGSAVPAGRLAFARAFATSANNGLKVVAAASTDAIMKVAGLTTEVTTAAQNAQVDVCGVQGAAGDLQIDASGNLISTILDLTTLGLVVGQYIWVGGATSGLQFAVAANTGFARVMVIAAGKLTLAKRTGTFTIDNGATKTVQILFGRYVRNVAVDHASYLERSFQFEAAFPNLQPVSGDEYEYALGNLANALSFALPLTDKATVTFGFIGTDTEVPTVTRKTNASTPVLPTKVAAFNTSADIARLRVQLADETGLTSYFKSLTLTIGNNVAPEKVLGTLGAAFMNVGQFDVGIEAQIVFTASAVTTAIRNNTTVGLDFALSNDDGGILFDVPTMDLGGGDREYPVNESVLLNTTGTAFGDPTALNTSLSLSVFPYLP